MSRMLRTVFAMVMAGVVINVGCGLFPEHYSSTDFTGTGTGGQGGGGTGGTGGKAPCDTNKDCDDESVCTKDKCDADGCTYTADDTAVPDDGNPCTKDECQSRQIIHTILTGEKCGESDKLKCTGEGVCKGCTMDSECGENDECMTSTCKADHTCDFKYQAAGTKVSNPVVGDCKNISCNGTGAKIEYPDDIDAPDDGKQCTTGVCINGEGEQELVPLGTPCSGGITYCNKSGMCAVCTENAGCKFGEMCYMEASCVSCKNSKKDGYETDVDCGGVCGGCPDGSKCTMGIDCDSHKCSLEKCVDCDDTIKNGDETDVDCGGSCASCNVGDTCKVNNDCQSMICSLSQGVLKCVSCADGIENGDETGVDCGGAHCLGCDADACVAGNECASGQCFGGVCCASACFGPCKACNIPMKIGICSNMSQGTDDPLCLMSEVCKNGVCVDDSGKKHSGESCTMGNQCYSNTCVNGKCS